ncbi:S53 family peptidase [Streptantibioticus parmotrematis]|uniref:S53 family peptidase n=1 Tax=Streptantibioticus parmotrematis TaxID=2873249 RepID=UPI0033F3BE2D
MSTSTPARRRRIQRIAGAVVSAAALVTAGLATAGPAGAATATAASAGHAHQIHVKRLCSQPKPGMMACNALVRTDVMQRMALGRDDAPSGYGPSDLQSAYNLPSDGGAGQTVAIVDAQDDPNAEQDLATYRQQYGLPACTSDSGCFQKVDQDGSTNYPTADSGWAGEISLDLDMVSAIAPNAHILLVEANSASMDDLGTAVNQAVSMGAKFVSNSYGGSEDSSDTQADSQYFNHPGVAITASAGDSGYGVEYPAASPDVTAVGGTSLTQDDSQRGWSETVWGSSDGGEGTGSGCSTIEPKPSWQTDADCSGRTVADVAAVADPATGVASYDSYQSGGWQVVGGTSAASPIIASVYADAGTPSADSNPASFPYANTSALNDVTSGSNGSCDDYLCNAGDGYDGPTGLGTPNGLTAFTG